MARALNDEGRAARLFGAYKSIIAAKPELARGFSSSTTFETKLKTTIDVLFSTYQANFKIEWQEGRAMSMEKAIKLALEEEDGT